jgi:hypothetical protein
MAKASLVIGQEKKDSGALQDVILKFTTIFMVGPMLHVFIGPRKNFQRGWRKFSLNFWRNGRPC